MLASKKYPRNYLSIVHDKMDKSKTSIPSICKRENIVSNVTDLHTSLTGMFTHGQKNGGFGHLCLSFLETGSNFSTTSLDKLLRPLEEKMVDIYGYLIYKSGTSKH